MDHGVGGRWLLALLWQLQRRNMRLLSFFRWAYNQWVYHPGLTWHLTTLPTHRRPQRDPSLLLTFRSIYQGLPLYLLALP